MRKITEQAVDAFNYKYNFKSGNTQVSSFADNTSMFLHGNCIAMIFNSGERCGEIVLSSCGWTTPTTKERLNGLLQGTPYYIKQKDFAWYLVNHLTKEMIPFEDGMSLPNTL